MAIAAPPQDRFAVPGIQAGLDLQLVFTFVALFARAEYALKASGCYYVPRKKVPKFPEDPFDAYVSWDKVAKKVHTKFRKGIDQSTADSFDYLENHPPIAHQWKKCLEGGEDKLKIHWDDQKELNSDLQSDEQARLARVLQSIATVRNNLFHGGKEISVWTPCERDTQLLSASIWVIGRVLEVFPAAHRKAFLDVPAA